ncbi:YraN family protein [Psychrobacter sp.]|uniref:YraN family protein n=1 Tax=Psychrobacter sp. TaxID=56811 RepID=UPI0025F08B56|nr:YraN family protein [Psychrobacter sp.]
MPSNPALLKSPKQRHGGNYEQLAADLLQQKGLSLIAKNWQQSKVGEIDLIMLHPGQAWDTLVFVEVRKRKVSNYGDALMSITAAKQRKIIKTARFFLTRNPSYAHLDCRFDVIAFNEFATEENYKPKTFKAPIKADAILSEPEWIQGAFIAKAW